jgi:hypothetical protein
MKSFLPDRLYDLLSWLALIALDALGELYKTLAGIWHWPYGEEVFETCVAVSICIGLLIGVSKIDYKNRQKQSIAQIESDLEEIEDDSESEDEDE